MGQTDTQQECGDITGRAHLIPAEHLWAPCTEAADMLDPASIPPMSEVTIFQARIENRTEL